MNREDLIKLLVMVDWNYRVIGLLEDAIPLICVRKHSWAGGLSCSYARKQTISVGLALHISKESIIDFN